MGDIHPAERYPAWVLQLLFLSAVALLFGGMLLLAGVRGLPNTPVLAVHCLLNGLVLLTVWNGCRTETEGWWLLQLAANLAAFGLGFVDLVLAGHAATHLQPHNTVLLALALPGAAGLIAFYLEHFRKKTVEETAAEDDAVLTREDATEDAGEGEPLTVAEKARAYASVVFFYVAYFGLFLGVLWLCVFWYGIVWRAVNDGAAFSAVDVLTQVRKAIQNGWPAAARMMLLIAAMIVLSLGWAVAEDKFKKYRARRKKPDAALNARVDAAVRAVWDFANRPGRKAKRIPIYVAPTLLFLGWAAAMTAYGANEKRFALQLFAARRGAAEGWDYFYGTGNGEMFVFLGGAAAMVALWFLLVSLWPGAAEAVVAVRYRRAGQNVSGSVETLRNCLTELFKKSGGEPFDAREYLLGRRRRFVRWVYGIATVVVPLALAGVWASLNTYTAFTSGGFVQRGAFASADLSWREVRSVEIACIVRERGWVDLTWRIRTADGRTANLVDGERLVERLPGLRKVDAILRAHGADFGPRVPPTAASDACLEKAGADLRDFRGFLRVMHRD